LTNSNSYAIIRVQIKKGIENMTYFLFYDGVCGEHFVVEGDDDWVAEDAYEEARNVVDVEDELEYLGVISDEEVDAVGYDVY
jgi:hypothetical protein